MNNILEEYLVKIGAQVDIGSFNGATRAISKLSNMFESLGNVLRYGKIVALFASVTDAVVGNIKATADLELEYKKLGNEMWVTSQTAKSLKVAMDIMNASEQDIAWVPELREQFFRLREEMNALATPEDADGQLSWIRQIGYDVQSLQLKLKMFREWLVYYLIKYLEPFIKEFQNFIQWLNRELGSNMPELAKKAAYWLSRILSIVASVGQVIGSITKAIYTFIDTLPARSKALVVAMAGIGAMIMAGPFGGMLMAISGALLLLEDFVYYMNGWTSSSTLAPMWQMLLSMGESDGLFGNLKDSLRDMLDTLSEMVSDIDFKGWLDDAVDGAVALLKGINDLLKALGTLGRSLNINGAKTKSFFGMMGDLIREQFRVNTEVLKTLGKIFSAMGEAVKGNWGKAASMVWGAIKDFGSGGGSNPTGRGYHSTNSNVAAGLREGFAAYEGMRMDNGSNGCVEAATKIGSYYSSFYQGALADNEVNVTRLRERAEREGILVVPFSDDALDVGDTVVYGDEDHVTIYAGNGRVVGNSSSRQKVMEQDLYLGGTIQPTKILKTGMSNGFSEHGGGSGSWGGFTASPTSYAANPTLSTNPQSSFGSVFTMGDINVTVANTNASPQEIAHAVVTNFEANVGGYLKANKGVGIR